MCKRSVRRKATSAPGPCRSSVIGCLHCAGWVLLACCQQNRTTRRQHKHSASFRHGSKPAADSTGRSAAARTQCQSHSDASARANNASSKSCAQRRPCVPLMMSNQIIPAHIPASLLVRPLVRLLARPLFFVLARHLAHLLDQLGIGFRVGLLHVCWLVVCFAAAHHVWVTNTKRADYGRRIAQGGQRRHARSTSRTQTRARKHDTQATSH